MKVEVLYLAGCPNHRPAVNRVRGALEQEGVSAEVVEIEVKDAATAWLAGFRGSPTIRIDGRDVEPGVQFAQPSGLTCRYYVDCGDRAGVPPIEWIRATVREVRRENMGPAELDRWDDSFSAGSGRALRRELT